VTHGSGRFKLQWIRHIQLTADWTDLSGRGLVRLKREWIGQIQVTGDWSN
jgi:hypothetical protein